MVTQNASHKHGSETICTITMLCAAALKRTTDSSRLDMLVDASDVSRVHLFVPIYQKCS
jgi:hypothetical protein